MGWAWLTSEGVKRVTGRVLLRFRTEWREISLSKIVFQFCVKKTIGNNRVLVAAATVTAWRTNRGALSGIRGDTYKTSSHNHMYSDRLYHCGRLDIA